VSTAIQLQKLIDIENFIGRESDKAILDKIFNAETCFLELQREIILDAFDPAWRAGLSGSPVRGPCSVRKEVPSDRSKRMSR
jgi:hypothetical protein